MGNKRRKISHGAFPPVQPHPTGNYEQRRAYRAIQRKLQKTRAKDIDAELAKLPPNVRELISKTRQLNKLVARKKALDDDPDRT